MKSKLLTLSLIAVSITAMAQTKIGNITISDAEASAYFLDCYNRPDTLTREYVDGCGDAMEKQVKEYNNWLSANSIAHIVVQVIHSADIDTVRTSMQLFGGESYACPHGSIKHEVPYFSPTKHENVKNYKGHEKDFTIVKSKEWIERVEIGFAVPRKPSEIDYIKYLKIKSK